MHLFIWVYSVHSCIVIYKERKNLDILFIGKIWTGKKNRSQESKYFWQCCFEGRRESAIWSVQSSVVTPHATRDNLIREHLFCLWRGHWCWLVTRLRGGESQNNGTQLVHWYLQFAAIGPGGARQLIKILATHPQPSYYVEWRRQTKLELSSKILWCSDLYFVLFVQSNWVVLAWRRVFAIIDEIKGKYFFPISFLH